MKKETRMPQVLIEAVIQARRICRKFSGEFAGFLEACESQGIVLSERWSRDQWEEFLRGLAEGDDMRVLLDNVQIHPRYWPGVLKSLRNHGFPEDFLEELAKEG